MVEFMRCSGDLERNSKHLVAPTCIHVEFNKGVGIPWHVALDTSRTIFKWNWISLVPPIDTMSTEFAFSITNF